MAKGDRYAPDRSNLYHYKLDLVLGEGGTGKVYRGIDTKRGEPVAVKLFHEAFFKNKLHVRDLAKCIKRFRKYDHPNVVKIFDFIDGEEGRCMVMEYIDGPNLGWYMENRPWNLQERLIICAQICNGLQYLHDQKCIHHDFKPANVLFTRQGLVKLADFSLYGSSFLIELLDQGAGQQVTPKYVPPEFLRKDTITNASDQYSLGIAMYLMFAGQDPFPVDTLQALYQCHLHMLPERPERVNQQCPPALGDIIMKLIAKYPKDRFGDCDEVRIALSDIGRSRI